MTRFRTAFFFFCAFAIQVRAQVPAPGQPQSKPIMITNATIHVGNGQVIENGVLCFENGLITQVANADDFKPDKDYEVIDAKGKQVYPGFILLDSQVGLEEIGQVRATLDNVETGTLNPSVRSLTAYDTDSELIPTFRFNGVLTAQVVPGGGLVSGLSSVMAMDGWNWEDAVIKTDEGLHINWPSKFKSALDSTTHKYGTVLNDKYEGQVRQITKLLQDAESYAHLDNKPVNVKLEALRPVLEGKRKVYTHANRAEQIMQAIRTLEKHQISRGQMVVVGGAEAYKILDDLKKDQIPVIISTTQRLPASEDEGYDMPYKLPALLEKEGIPFAIADNQEMASSSRNLGFAAGNAVPYGLDREKALQSITLSAAKILGMDDKLGTLEKGKFATLFISDGDALDMRGNKVEKAFIHGAEVHLNAMQQRLYEKYMKKYGLSE